MAPTYPDFDRCSKPSGMPPYAKHLQCRSPYHGEKPVDFTFPTDLPMRRRPSAHRVDDETLGKYDRAVHLMKELPLHDPRNFLQQANVHCAYCNCAYYMGNTNKRFNVHAGWFFLPWHRWYLYFYERILANLLGDDTFALPFWNWDFEEGMTIPPMYLNEMLRLYDEKRNPNHGASTIIDLNMNCEQREHQVRYNYKVMYMQIVSLAKTTRAFHGGRISTDISECKCAAGTLEHVPHNAIHNWTGNVVRKQQCPCPSQTCYGEDMGTLYSAARDPIFLAHHANVDRMWTLWKQLPERKDYDDPDLLDSHFFFYDENKRFVRVRVGDCFDPAKLRYAYEDCPTPWLQNPEHTKAALALPLPAGSAVQKWSSQYDIAFTLQPVKIIVARQQKPAGTCVEELLIEGIRVQRNIVVKFDVFVNLDDRCVATHYVDTVPKEYAGTFVQLPRGAKEDLDGGCGQSSLCLGISEVLSDMEVGEEEESIVVTLIPKVEVEEPIQISAIRMEYYI